MCVAGMLVDSVSCDGHHQLLYFKSYLRDINTVQLVVHTFL